MNGEKVAALSMLPIEGKEAARELARCVGKMKFVGGCIGMSRQTRLEGEEWEALWDVAERYRVPILLREMWPVGSEVCCFSIVQRHNEGAECRTDICRYQSTNTHSLFQCTRHS
jgi:predicted TIM-barrel fold metal-dependent hydrolase